MSRISANSPAVSVPWVPGPSSTITTLVIKSVGSSVPFLAFVTKPCFVFVKLTAYSFFTKTCFCMLVGMRHERGSVDRIKNLRLSFTAQNSFLFELQVATPSLPEERE